MKSPYANPSNWVDADVVGSPLSLASAAAQSTHRETLWPTAAARLPRAARIVLAMLARLEEGHVHVKMPAGNELEFGSGTPRASVTLASHAVFDAVIRHGDIGFAESYIAGLWDTDQLSDVLRIMVANRRIVEQAVYGSWWGNLLLRARHALNRNTRAGSRRNIHAHYDLGNAFYECWLDPGMTYSSAWFDGDDSLSLEAAQEAKYQRLWDQLRLTRPGRVLEIGCGWGGFAELAARNGSHVTGLTLSTEQHRFATERLQRAGLQGRSDIVLRDYRDEAGRYDAIASIEMFEAVGEAYWPAYFQTIKRCLQPGGRAAIQTIVIDDALFDRYRRSTDFIQQYIFPGGMLPSPGAFEKQAHAAGLKVVDRMAFGKDYARTLREWSQRFERRLHDVRELGFDERFVRIWRFYLAYCEAAFDCGNTDVIHFTLEHR